jgi:isoleucyl-tRNA synthetase
MPEIDRYALHRLQELTERIVRAYAEYEFHVVYHRLTNYCTLDLSAFYLDVLKDRLYTSPPASTARRSAQTVIYAILDNMARLMAPILAFTAEEIWQHMPARRGKAESVHMVSLPEVRHDWKDETLQQRWQLLLNIRAEVAKALETARNKKEIGHALDAAVTLSTSPELYSALAPYEAELRSIFIVSKARLLPQEQLENAYRSEDVKGLAIAVAPAGGDKCERCWVHEPSVGSYSEHPTICKRCKSALEQL